MDNTPASRRTLTRPTVKTPTQAADHNNVPAPALIPAPDTSRAKNSAKTSAKNTSKATQTTFAAPRGTQTNTPRGNVWRSDALAPKHSAPQHTQQPVQPPARKQHNVPQAITPVAGADQNNASGTRLNKRMADLGLCSRREADAWIDNGWVFVNEQPAVTGQRVTEQDHIHIDRSAYGQQEQQVTILLHKPVGYVSGLPEDGHSSALTLINNLNHWRGDRRLMRFLPRQMHGLAPAGRLDIDSTGLLVLTQDGRVARQLISQHGSVDKEYLVRVAYPTPDGRLVSENVQAVFPAEQLALLRHGLSLDDQPLKPAQVDWQNPEQLRFVLTEGKKRQIRRMCEAVALKVTALKRVRIGKIVLGDLPQGKWRYLHPDEQF